MLYPNPYQPRRPGKTDDGVPLNYRTHISKPDAKYDTFGYENAVCQCHVYRWARNSFKNRVPIADLHAHLFYKNPEVSKKHLGATVLQAVRYDPRIMKSKTLANPKACMVYTFRFKEELIYGLEWMIAMWMRKVVTGSTREDVAEGLEELAACSDSEVDGLFMAPFLEDQRDGKHPPVDWQEFWYRYELKPQLPIRVGGPKNSQPPEPSSLD